MGIARLKNKSQVKSERQEKKCRRSEVVKVTERVLVTEWIDGVKLDASKESDVAAASAS